MRRIDGGCFGVDELTLSSSRVAWIEEAGGNSLKLTSAPCDLQAASRPRSAAVEATGLVGRGVSNGSYIGQLFGAGALLAWNAWELSAEQASVLRAKAGRRLWNASSPGCPGGIKNSASTRGLVAVGGGSGRRGVSDTITVLAPNGARLATVPATGVRRVQPRLSIQGVDALAVALDATRLAVERAATLDLFDAATSAKTKSVPLGKAARFDLAGINAKVALLTTAPTSSYSGSTIDNRCLSPHARARSSPRG